MQLVNVTTLVIAALLANAAMRSQITFAGESTLPDKSNSLMPQPAELTLQQGRLAIDGTFRVALSGYQEPRLHRAAMRLVRRLARQTGIPMLDQPEADVFKATLVIQCDHASE